MPTYQKIIIVSFVLNIFWELIHSRLYATCLAMPRKKYYKVIIWASIKDSFWIFIFYLITAFIFNKNILNNYGAIFLFSILCLIFSFVDEKISLKLKRWEYSINMPKIFGVGLTPLLELAITGLITFFIISKF